MKAEGKDNILNLLRNKGIYIYGAGYVSNLFYEKLKRENLGKNLKGFIITFRNFKKENFGYRVSSIDEVKICEDDIICIAVHETLLKEIESILLERGIKNYIWVYPYLYDPVVDTNQVERIEWVDIKKFKPSMEGQYGIALRCYAIEEYYGKNREGYRMYERGMAVYSDLRTARLRKERFKRLILNWEEKGYLENELIYINEDYDVVDGEHRMALAIYHQLDRVKCRFCAGGNIHEKYAKMTAEVLRENDFSEDELRKLDEINRRILERWGLKSGKEGY